MLNEFLEDYQEYEEDEALDDFIFNLWESNYEPRTYTKNYRFFIDTNVMTDENMIELFKPYTNLKVRYAKSYYNDSPTSIDMIRIHVNNMYLYLTHKEVYLGKEYYDTIFEYRSLYFKTIERLKNGEIISAEDIEYRINSITDRLEDIKIERLKKKVDLKFADYRELINTYICRLFNNYKPPHVYEEEFGWELRDEYTGWTEDNYIVKYFCKSLTGYLINYVNTITKEEFKVIECQNCKHSFSTKTLKTKYCEVCLKEITKIRRKINNKKYYRKNKTAK